MAEKQLTVRQADMIDLDLALDFYNTLIDEMKDMENTPRWRKNVYPCLTDLVAAITGQNLFLAENDETIVVYSARIDHPSRVNRSPLTVKLK